MIFTQVKKLSGFLLFSDTWFFWGIQSGPTAMNNRFTWALDIQIINFPCYLSCDLVLGFVTSKNYLWRVLYNALLLVIL